MEPDDWINAGYRRWETNRHELHRLADFGLQKRFDDEHGKKYFITVYAYDRTRYPDWGTFAYPSRYAFMGEVQFCLTNGITFNVDMNGEFTIEQVESHYEKLWEHFGKPYYEKWVE